jgi:GntR family transcriptional regulator
VERQRGRGTTVRPRILEQRLGALYSLALGVTDQGLSEHNEVLAAERRRPEPEIREELGLGRGEAVLFLERLRFAGEEPLALERSWLPWSMAEGLRRADLEHGALYQALRDVCGITVTSGSERIAPAIPPPGDRRLLEMPPGAVAFAVERRAEADGRPVELRRSTIRGDRYRFVMEWPTR